MEIKERQLQDETILEIGKFAVLWNWFEGTYFERECNAYKIEESASEFVVGSAIQNQFANQLKERCSRFGQDIETYVRESLHDLEKRNVNDRHIAEIVRFLQQTGNDTTCGCLLAVCRIRNNLMHGIKDIRELDDQIELFKTANGVLENLKRS